MGLFQKEEEIKFLEEFCRLQGKKYKLIDGNREAPDIVCEIDEKFIGVELTEAMDESDQEFWKSVKQGKDGATSSFNLQTIHAKIEKSLKKKALKDYSVSGYKKKFPKFGYSTLLFEGVLLGLELLAKTHRILWNCWFKSICSRRRRV